MAGAANFVGFFTFGLAIAKTVGKGIIQIDHVTLPLVLAALVGAIIWDILAWRLALPTSSSHALIGGLVGAGIAAVGFHVVIWLFRNADYTKSKGVFKSLQLVSSFIYSIGHGTNDAQKTMGIIALALFTGGITKTFVLPDWVVLSCYTAISLGTAFGGWRIVKTMGTQITKIRAREGFCAETTAAFVLLATAHFGIPVSTTHVISGSIMGVGTVESSKINLRTARKIVGAWFLTIPFAALCSAICYFVISCFF
jgi:PiT family inorganic phosphate transporter